MIKHLTPNTLEITAEAESTQEKKINKFQKAEAEVKDGYRKENQITDRK